MSPLQLVEERINAEQTEKMEVFIGENSCEDEGELRQGRCACGGYSNFKW
jgi:hypothetical protein